MTQKDPTNASTDPVVKVVSNGKRVKYKPANKIGIDIKVQIFGFSFKIKNPAQNVQANEHWNSNIDWPIFENLNDQYSKDIPAIPKKLRMNNSPGRDKSIAHLLKNNNGKKIRGPKMDRKKTSWGTLK